MQMEKPPWLKIRPDLSDLKKRKRYNELRKKVKEQNLHTVCEESHCPNMAECWECGTATFMILGDTCTRACKFCNVKTGYPKGEIDSLEPSKLAKQIREMNLDYAVITSVDRDDLNDGGASHFAECIKSVKAMNPETKIEVLIPDFRGDKKCIDMIIEANPLTIAQNLETVQRLSEKVRDIRAGYEQTLDVLAYIKEKNSKMYTKSSLMVGLGEKEDEIMEALQDLRKAKVDFVTIGQYLQPSKKQLQVQEFISPEQFEKYGKEAKKMGFLGAFCGPFVRSSYKASLLQINF